MSDDLTPNSTDYVAATAKAVLGMVPFAGSLLAELAGTVIPQQRLDRLTVFSKKLEAHIEQLDQDSVRTKLSDENFTDLFEETARQAAQAVTDERKEYLASLLSRGISETHISYVESKHLLRILSQINDIEVIWLRFYHYPYLSGDDEFRNKHAAILEPVVATLGSDQETLNKQALQENYTEHLVSLGLLRRRVFVDGRTKQPVFDTMCGRWRTEGTETTPLGRLLLQHIGLSELQQ